MSTQGHESDGSGEDKVLVGEYALGLLDAAEHERMARRIAAEPALRAELQLWRSQLSGLDAEFREEPPPPRVLEQLEARLFGTAARHRSGLWDSLALWRSLAAGGIAVAAVAVGFNVMQPPPIDPTQFATQLVAAIKAQEGFGVEFVALYNAATGEVRLTGLSGQAIPDKDYELWYIKGDEPAVSMGVIPVDQRSEIELDPQARSKFAPGTVLAVTLEQKGGSPTGVAQGPVVALGTATPI
ncbi:anti-sigma factor [Devosia sp.]|uniref:anti-sigma factor n=1 Tax=Devosia sp. TaxID=1871048 RepID=UPI002EE983F0